MDEIASPQTEADSQDAATAPSGPAKGPVRAYCPAVLAERQPRVSDLIPIRPFLATFLILAGLTGIAAIETIHIHVQTLPLGAAAEQVVPLNVSARGSIAAYYSSMLLALASLGSLAVFGIRAHRVDDYRGRYRIWLWSAAALAFASLDVATGLRDAVGLGMSLLAGQSLDAQSLAASAKLGWLGLYGLVFGTLLIRVGIEIWSSLPSFTALATAGLCYVIAVLLQFEMFQAASPLVGSVIASTVAMVAHLGLLAAVALYARHVHLDAQGRLKVHIDPEKRKPKKAKSRAKLKVVKEDKDDDRSDKQASRTAAADPAKPATKPRFGFGLGGSSSAKPAATISKSAANSSADYDNEDDDLDEDESDGQRLSKAERRRLKKQARRDQQRRAA